MFWKLKTSTLVLGSGFDTHFQILFPLSGMVKNMAIQIFEESIENMS